MIEKNRQLSVNHHILKDQFDYIAGILKVANEDLLSKEENEALSTTKKSIDFIRESLGSFIERGGCG